MFQYPDTKWNHGEGFILDPSGQPQPDVGGWYSGDDGTQLDSLDVFYYGSINGSYASIYPMWCGYPLAAPEMRRFVGFLRSRNEAPRTDHPLYGLTNPYPFVDDAAFEVFAPSQPWNGTDPIVVAIGNFQTLIYPKKHVSTGVAKSYDFRTRYPGLYSPDGLLRDEADGTVTGFLANTNEDNVKRAPSADLMQRWRAAGSAAPFYLITAYIVPPAIHRPAELILQRDLQLVKAIKLLLADASRSPFNPPLTVSQVADLTVVFLGASNGGNQAILGPLLHPDLVHGAYGMVFGPSLQRVFGEQEMGWAISHLSGFADFGASLEAIDMRNWGQLAWNRGFELYDLSVLRRFALGQTVRPFFVYAGDEDITTTGTGWIVPLAGGTTFQNAGEADQLSTRSFAWASGEKCGHYWRPVTDPYTGQQVASGIEWELIGKAIQSRIAQPAIQPLQHLVRQSGEELRGIDDPQEWFFGRPGTPAATVPATNPPLSYDPGFFAAVQPGAAGTWLGHKESLLIHDQHVYVGSTEGVVSRFHVDWNSPKQELVRDAQSAPLGHEAWALLFLDSGDLVVGTRRYLHLLHADLTPVTSGGAPVVVQLPWEQAKPYRMHLAEVYLQNQEKEIVFASAQGGLVAFTQGLGYPKPGFSNEYAEPGVQDFIVSGTINNLSVLTLLSERGVVANLVFDLNAAPGSQGMLTAASAPQDGVPVDLEAANLFVGTPGQGGFLTPATVALYGGDEQGYSLRIFNPVTMFHAATVPNIAVPAGAGHRYELVPAHHNLPETQNGDHLLLLINDSLILYNESSQVVGTKTLFQVPTQPGRLAAFTPGMHACAVATGELGDGANGEYPEEVVVATQTGHLLWMHLSEVAAAGTSMPLDYGMYTGAGSAVQPRTNQALSCAWGIADKPGDPTHLHLLDQDDNHWTVDHVGGLELVNASLDVQVYATEVRGWGYLGVTGVSGSFSPQDVRWTPLGLLASLAWCPMNASGTLSEMDPFTPGTFPPNNWSQRLVPQRVFDGFAVFGKGGDVLVGGNNRDCFWWSNPPGLDQNGIPDPNLGVWCNMIQGVSMTGGTVDGVWASTDNAAGTGGTHAFLDLRQYGSGVPSMDQQSIRVAYVGGTRYLVIGCPGGRVRVIQSGVYDQGPGDHGIGGVIASSADYGHGGSALAIVPDSTGIDIYFGVIVRHAVAVTYPNQPLQDSEVMTGRIVKLRYEQTVDSLVQVWVRDLQPGAADRGGYGVVGLYVDEIFPNAPAAEEKEVVATTMSGDVYVYSESGGLRFRSSVPGAAGFYNSILARDLNSDGSKELYVSGSMGLHRFTTPLETGIINP